MKVLMLGRIGLLDARGGDRVQVENTALELKNLGVEVDIRTDMDFEPKIPQNGIKIMDERIFKDELMKLK